MGACTRVGWVRASGFGSTMFCCKDDMDMRTAATTTGIPRPVLYGEKAAGRPSHGSPACMSMAKYRARSLRRARRKQGYVTAWPSDTLYPHATFYGASSTRHTNLVRETATNEVIEEYLLLTTELIGFQRAAARREHASNE